MSNKFARRPPSRDSRPKVIIACEGKKTERFYFDEIKRVERLTSVRVEILPHEGTDPRTVVGQLADFIRQERRENGWVDDRDTAWAVFDGDEHRQTPGDLVNWNTAMQQARDWGIHTAVVNPSFEYWYLLHYEDYRRALHRDQALSLLRRHYPRYEKYLPMYLVLKAATPTAISRARNLARLAQNSDVHEHDNPCSSEVANLVARLLNI